MKRLFLVLVYFAATAFAQAAEIGDDGLHKAPWMRDTFKDLREDLDEANAEGKRLLLLIEQRGCIYCKKMHEEVFVDPTIFQMIEDHYFVVQINMFGDVEVTDFDGVTLSEKNMVKRWGALFTPNMVFLPQTVGAQETAITAAVSNMPGAFGRWTTLNMLRWVVEEGYAGDEPFQKYHARKFAEESQ